MSDQSKVPAVPAVLVGLFPGANAGVTVESVYQGRQGVVLPTHDPKIVVVHFSDDSGSFALAELSLLLDSPLAMCHAARWLVVRLGGDPGTTAPPWFFDNHPEDHWCLYAMRTTFAFYGTLERNPNRTGRWFHVPDIHKLTDPATALAAVCASIGAT